MSTFFLPGRPLVVAHRGASGRAPENTLAAFRLAIELGADAIELDVRRTADGHLVIMHDAAVDRTTDGHGPVATQTLAALRRLDAGGWRGPVFAGERVPTLEEVCDLVRPLRGGAGQPMRLCIEVKTEAVFGDVEGLEADAARFVTLADMSGRVEVSCFDHLVLRAFKAAAPEIPCGILYTARLIDPFQAAAHAGAEALHPNWVHVSADLAPEAHRRGLFVVAWTANDPLAIARLVEAGVDAVISDHPDRVRAVVS